MSGEAPILSVLAGPFFVAFAQPLYGLLDSVGDACAESFI